MKAAQDTPAGLPRFVTAGGRGKTGKSTTLAIAIQRALDAGKDPIIADGDLNNASLRSRFGEAACQPPSDKPHDVFRWVCGLVDRQVEEQCSVYLDLGGGNQALKVWAREMEPVTTLAEFGVEFVMLYCLSPDLDDLAHVLEMERVLQAPKTALIFNEGSLGRDEESADAFAKTRERMGRSDFQAIRERAVMLGLPRLSIMREVENKVALKPTQQALVRIWEKKVAAEFKGIQDWLV